jgi:hypothetical protein
VVAVLPSGGFDSSGTNVPNMENRRAGGPYKPNYEDKYLRVDFTFPEVIYAEGAF